MGPPRPGRLHHSCRANATTFGPAAMATYWRSSKTYVIGDAFQTTFI
jgi:hypothetical protein